MAKNKSKYSIFSKNLIVVAVAVVVGVVLYYTFFNSPNSSNTLLGKGNPSGTEQYQLRRSSDGTIKELYKGNPDAKAIIIEYSDFQCPACRHMNEKFQAIWRVVQDDVLLVYRHYPLSQHQHARLIATMSEAMQRQEKFWAFHDLIFDNQEEWQLLGNSEARTFFEQLVIQAGGDLDQLNKDLSDPTILTEIEAKIDQDMSYGEASELAGTPTLILNGQKIDIPNNLSTFVSDIKRAAGKLTN